MSVKNNVQFKLILTVLKKEIFIGKLLYILMYIAQHQDLSSSSKFSDEKGVTLTSQSISLGKDIVNVYIKTLRDNHIKNNPNDIRMFLVEFRKKHINENLLELLNTDSFRGFVCTLLIEVLKSAELLESYIQTTDKKSNTYLRVSDKVADNIEVNQLQVLPVKFPMVYSPVIYNENKLGGYFLNDKEYIADIFIPKAAYKINSVIDVKAESGRIIYNTINRMSRTPFKINTDLLDIL